jgi:hypothetical protein
MLGDTYENQPHFLTCIGGYHTVHETHAQLQIDVRRQELLGVMSQKLLSCYRNIVPYPTVTPSKFF